MSKQPGIGDDMPTWAAPSLTVLLSPTATDGTGISTIVGTRETGVAGRSISTKQSNATETSFGGNFFGPGVAVAPS
jgi:hypothetical protein